MKWVLVGLAFLAGWAGTWRATQKRQSHIKDWVRDYQRNQGAE